MSIVYVILAILLFGVLVIVHELGHFTVAKLCGVKVEEFAVGMGPALLQKQKGETVYSLRAVPFGGFCAMAGEDQESDEPRAFTNQAAWKRVLILAAGSFMNFLLGFVIVLILYWNAVAFWAPVIAQFREDCPYQGEEALQLGDRFYSIDGHRIYQYQDVTDFLSQGDGTYDIVVIRDGEKVELEDFYFVPVEYEGESQKLYGFSMGTEEATFPVKLRYAWNTTMEFGRWVWMGLSELVKAWMIWPAPWASWG